jgi:hypothetical protein
MPRKPDSRWSNCVSLYTIINDGQPHSVAHRKNAVLSVHYHKIGFQRLKAGETRLPLNGSH